MDWSDLSEVTDWSDLSKMMEGNSAPAPKQEKEETKPKNDKAKSAPSQGSQDTKKEPNKDRAHESFQDEAKSSGHQSNKLDNIKIDGWTDMKQFDDDHDPDWFAQEEKNIAKIYGGHFIKVKYSEQGRSKYFCEICLAEMNAKKSLEAHCEGMKHLKKKALWEKKNKQDAEEDDEGLRGGWSAPGPPRGRGGGMQRDRSPLRHGTDRHSPPPHRGSDMHHGPRGRGYDGPHRGHNKRGRHDGPHRGHNKRGRHDGPQSRDYQHGRYDGSHDRLHGPPDNFHGPPDNFHGPPDNFHGPPDNFHGPPDNFRGPPDNFRGPPDNFRGPPDNFRGPPDNIRGPPDNIRGPPDNIRGPPDNFRGPPDNFRGPPDNIRGPPDNIRGPPDHIRGPPDNIRGPPDNFRGPPDNIRGPPKEKLRGGTTGMLLTKLSMCCIKDEEDADLALSVVSSLASSLREYNTKKGEKKIAELLMEAELKLNTLKALQVGLKLLDNKQTPGSSAAATAISMAPRALTAPPSTPQVPAYMTPSPAPAQQYTPYP